MQISFLGWSSIFFKSSSETSFAWFSDVVKSIAKESKVIVNWLLEQGVKFTKKSGSSSRDKLHLTQEGGHTYPRIVHAADKTGEAIQESLINKGLSQIIKRHFNTRDCIQFSLIENYANEKTNINNANEAFMDIINIQEEWYKRKNKNLSNTT